MKIGKDEASLLYLLLVFVPVAFILHLSHAGGTWVFIASGLAIIPLAGILGEATEHLAEHVGPGIGGLLNATFGNAAEHSAAILMAIKNKMDIAVTSPSDPALRSPCFWPPCSSS